MQSRTDLDMGTKSNVRKTAARQDEERIPQVLSKSDNFVFCPKSIIKKKKNVRVQWINDYFKNFGKKSKKRRKKRGKKYKKGKSRRKTKSKKKREKKSKWSKES